jgi:hypothetical protein
MSATENVVSQETPELTEHEQEMINLVQEREQQAKASADPSLAEPAKEEPEQSEQPEESIDYKAKYEELQKQLQEKESNPNLDIKEEEQASEDKPQEATDVLTPNELNKFTEEFNTNGELSEDSYSELSKLGLSKEVVDTYIEGQIALQEVRVNRVFNEVGGKESYQSMIEWAKDNWDTQQIEVFNRNVNSGDDALVMFSVKALKENYEKANGSPIPNRALKGSAQGDSNGSGLKGYESKQEMFKAMRNPAYGKDPSYTKMVENKIKNSKF